MAEVPAASPPARSRSQVDYQPIALVDLLDRLLAGGVVITGEIRLSIADVDMVSISLQALISSVSTAFGPATGVHHLLGASSGEERPHG